MIAVLVRPDGHVLWQMTFVWGAGNELVVPPSDHPALLDQPRFHIGIGETLEEAIADALAHDPTKQDPEP